MKRNLTGTSSPICPHLIDCDRSTTHLKNDFAPYMPCLAQFVSPRRLGQPQDGGDSGFQNPGVDQGRDLGELGGIRVNHDPFAPHATIVGSLWGGNAQSGDENPPLF